MISNNFFQDDDKNTSNDKISSISSMLNQVIDKNTFEKNFYKNIATEISEEILEDLGQKLKDLYEKDLEDNEKRIDIINQGYIALGLTKASDDTTDDDFINPAFLTSYIKLANEFAAELFAPNHIVQAIPLNINNNPKSQPQPQSNQQPNVDPTVKEQNPLLTTPIIKKRTPEEEITLINKKSQFAVQDMNLKLSEEWRDIKIEIQRAIQQSFIAGSSIVHIYYDKGLQRPIVDNLKTDKVVMDPNAKSLSSAMRISFEKIIPEKLMRDKIYSREYLPIIESTSHDGFDQDNTSEVDQTRSDITGITMPEQDPTNPFEYVYRTVTSQVFISIKEIGDKELYKDGIPKYILLPYEIEFLRENGKILSVKRQWDFKDPLFRKIHNLIDFMFLIDSGPFGIGLSQVAVPLARIATQLHRQLVKSAKIANFPSALIRSDSNIVTKEAELNEYQLTPVSTTSDRLSDVVMPIPFNNPSPIMMDILRQFEESILNLAGTMNIKMENLPSNIKSSLLFAIIDKEMKPQSAVMRNYQQSFNDVLKMIQRILHEEMGEFRFGEFPTILEDEILINKDVYGAPLRIKSAADPTLTSSAAQLIRNQTLLELAQSAPELHNLHEIYYRTYTSMHIDNIDMILKTPEQLSQEAQAQQQASANTPTQIDVLMADVQQKSQEAQARQEIDVMKIQAKQETDKLKIMASQQAKNQEFENQKIKDLLDKIRFDNDALIKKTKVEAETGIPIKIQA